MAELRSAEIFYRDALIGRHEREFHEGEQELLHSAD